MRKKGFSLVEIVMVLVIVTVASGVFYGLIEEMFHSANFIMGRKDSYQVAREALKLMANEIRWDIRGGDQHNLGQADRSPYVSPDAAWQYCRTWPSTNIRFVFMPDFDDGVPVQGGPDSIDPDDPNPNLRVRFFWGNNANLTGLPASGWYLRREEETDDDPSTAPDVTALAAVKDSTRGSLEIRYYDQSGNLIPIVASGITWTQARTVGKIELILTVNRWGQPVTLTETIYVREKGRLAGNAGYL